MKKANILLFVSVLACLLMPSPGSAQLLDRIVAIVDEDIITSTELDREVANIKQQQRAQGLHLPPDQLLTGQVLESLIIRSIQQQLAKSNGITVDDNTLNLAIRNIARQNDMTLTQFHAALSKDNIDFEDFRESIRDEITFRRLRQRFVDSQITVSDQEIDNFLANERAQGEASTEEYRLGHILIAVPEGATSEQIRAARTKAQSVLDKLHQDADFQETASSYSDGAQALQGGDLGWRKGPELPTLFAQLVPQMKTQDISDLIRSPSGFHIIKLLDRRNSEQHFVEQTHARHILVKPDELMTDDEAQQLLEQLRQRVGQGEDFSKLAMQYSDDKVSASQGGDLGWTSPGQMVPEFESALEKLQPGQVSEPVKTQFGWHLIEVLARRKLDDTDTYNRNKIKQQIFQRKSEEAYSAWLRRLRNEAYVENLLTPKP